MSEQLFYGHGKLLLSGEYFVLDGAKALALPTTLGQKMFVKSRPSNDPKLFWKSFDVKNNCWLEVVFELWHFNIVSEDKENPSLLTLQKILRQARKQNIHFLRDGDDIFVETKIEFPLNWGLGSSSTLVYNIAQWAYISPFELLDKTFGGSGYDIACAQSLGPIQYEISNRGPHWETINFNPHFKDQIYFIYLNKKQNSREGIKDYKEASYNKEDIIKRLNIITDELQSTVNLKEFEELIFEHENIISLALGKKRVKDIYFSDFWGAVKSLGAWGGDFALVTSSKSFEETKAYFSEKGFESLLKFDELILQNFQKLSQSSIYQVEEKLNAAVQ